MDSQVLQLGSKRQRRVLHLLLVPILFFVMYWYDWNTSTVITCSIFLAMVGYWTFVYAVNRHVTIDPVRKMVEIEWIQWGLLAIDKRQHPFAEFSAVRYHTYQHGDGPLVDQCGLYLVHSVADLCPCGDTGLGPNEPRYDRDMAVRVAQMMALPLLESDDKPWEYQPKFKKTTLFAEQASA